MRIGSIKSCALVLSAVLLCAAVFSGCTTNYAASGSLSSSSSSAMAGDSQTAESSNSSGTSDSQASSSASSASLEGQKYTTYINARYGFAISVPAELTETTQPDNGDGKIFSSADGSVKLTASGINNIQPYSDDNRPYSVSEYMNEVVLSSLTNVTYKESKDNWFAVSWTSGDKITYERGVVGKRSINEYTLTYPASRKSEFDSIIETINKSFKTPGIDEYH